MAKKEFVIESKADLEKISKRGGIYIDVENSRPQHRAYVGRLHGLVRDDRVIGEIAGAKLVVTPCDQSAIDSLTSKSPDWLDLQEQCNCLLRHSDPVLFIVRLDRHLQLNPDGALFALIYLAASEKMR